jgi:uncharacterized protein YbbC (DUF1343 family)
VNFIITDWARFRSFELGLVVAHALRTLHPDAWETEQYMRLLGNNDVYQRLLAGDDVAEILKSVDKHLSQFRERRKPFELYQ